MDETPPTQAARTAGNGAPAARTQFVNFLFLKIDPAFRTLQSNEKLVAKQEFLAAFDRYSGKTTVIAYSLVGLRADCDLLLWRVDSELEAFQEMSARLMTTGIGKYLTPVYSYLSATARPESLETLPLEPIGTPRPEPGKKKFLFLHPFIKSRRWYELPRAERQKILEEQVRIRSKHPGVVLHTTYSFGLDDQEFMMAFESDRPDDFLELAAELKESGWGAYTLRDTPNFTCVSKDLREILDGLG
jgi:chlorite dismutase